MWRFARANRHIFVLSGYGLWSDFEHHTVVVFSAVGSRAIEISSCVLDYVCIRTAAVFQALECI